MLSLDPRLFDPAAIDPATRVANEQLERTLDPLLDDSLFMAARWTAAGNRAELAVYPGGVHGFNLFPIPLAKGMAKRCHAFVTEALR